MSNPYANYYEDHESRESLCAAEHVAECALCHEANAERTIEFEGKDMGVCVYCYTAIKGFERGEVA